MSNKCTIEGRLRSNIWKKRYDNDKKEDVFKINVIITDKKYVKRLKAVRDHVLEEKYGSKIPKGMTDYVHKLRQVSDEDKESEDEIMFINIRTANDFKRVVKRDGAFDTLSEDDDLARAGDVVAVSVSAFVTEPKNDQSFKPTVSLGINSLMHVRLHPDGRTSGPVLDTSDFDDFESEENSDENWDD